jgi:xylan 1,4-beta-xylosidase
MMKKNIILVLFMHLGFLTSAQHKTVNAPKNDAYNLDPIFAGDYPDPSILRDGDNYYIVHSSFEY